MVKVKSKVNRDNRLTKRGKVIRQGTTVAPQSQAEGASEPLEYWDEAVSFLKARRFNAVDEALAAVVEIVAHKVSKGRMVESDLRTFLYDLLDTDPELKEELKTSLGIK